MSRPEPNETRRKILEAARELLETAPAAAVRMSDIAKAAGLSRQAVYLHFPTRAELLIATTRYVDAVENVDRALAPSRAAKTGVERLDAYVAAWAAYIPKIYGVAKALLAMQATDEAARAAWADRMAAMREGCAAAIAALARDGCLAPDIPAEEATDLLWSLLSVRNWEQLTQDRGWSQEKYAARMKALTRKLFVA